jgi:hypothetical protein
VGQGDVEKTLAENYIQKLGGSNPIKIKFSAHPPNDFISDQLLFSISDQLLLLEIFKSINTKKSFGGDNIPLELIDNPLGRDIAYDQLRKTLNDTNPNNVFFQARLLH